MSLWKKTPPTAEQMSFSLASKFGLSAGDVSKAFEGKEDSLRTYFNTANKASHDRTKYGIETAALAGVTVAFFGIPAIVTVPVGGYTGYKTYEANKKLNW